MKPLVGSVSTRRVGFRGPQPSCNIKVTCNSVRVVCATMCFYTLIPKLFAEYLSSNGYTVDHLLVGPGGFFDGTIHENTCFQAHSKVVGDARTLDIYQDFVAEYQNSLDVITIVAPESSTVWRLLGPRIKLACEPPDDYIDSVLSCGKSLFRLSHCGTTGDYVLKCDQDARTRDVLIFRLAFESANIDTILAANNANIFTKLPNDTLLRAFEAKSSTAKHDSATAFLDDYRVFASIELADTLMCHSEYVFTKFHDTFRRLSTRRVGIRGLRNSFR